MNQHLFEVEDMICSADRGSLGEITCCRKCEYRNRNTISLYYSSER